MSCDLSEHVDSSGDLHCQVLEVVRANYDTLTLKLQDNLDYFEKYTEKAKETAFFTQLVSISLNFV